MEIETTSPIQLKTVRISGNKRTNLSYFSSELADDVKLLLKVTKL
jgi:hypothetical protein